MSPDTNDPKPWPIKPSWYEATSKYAQPNLRKAIFQLLNTFLPYFGMWALLLHSVRRGYPFWLTMVLAGVAALLLVRIFVFFHDCCHGCFFASLRANRLMGYVSGILTFTPFEDWRRSHAAHHHTIGNLDRRGVYHVWMLTVDEYLAASMWQRFVYRVYRNPFIMFGFGPAVKFFIINRFATEGARRPERKSVIFTNSAILVIIGVAILTVGIKAYLLIQIPIVVIGGAAGLWLFYVQHQFEGVYWARHENWDPIRAALEGSSYYKLPQALQWMTGNIGLHHIHHVRPRIPNYNLQQCCEDVPALREVEPMTIRRSFRCLRLKLWDEKRQKLISFRSLDLPSETSISKK
jgi:omega-6 fatty acid desaturase (delta-12 desaturase)